jgi:hypothetical protein
MESKKVHKKGEPLPHQKRQPPHEGPPEIPHPPGRYEQAPEVPVQRDDPEIEPEPVREPARRAPRPHHEVRPYSEG